MFIAIFLELSLQLELEAEVWAYDLVKIGFSIFLKYFDISLTSLFILARIKRGMVETKDSLTTFLPLVGGT